MADPKNYALVRLADSIGDKALLTYDAATDTITDSGTTAGDGSIQASSGSLSLGTQTRTSGGDEVVSTDLVTGETFANAWYEINEVPVNITYTREFGPLVTVQRFSINSDVVEDPSFSVNVPVNEVVFRLKTEFVEAHPKMEMRVTKAGKERWREVRAVSAGVQELILKPPVSLLSGDYEFTFHSLIPNVPLRMKGDLQNNRPAYSVSYQSYKNTPLATKDYVLETVTGGQADDVMLKSVYDTDNNGKVGWSDWAAKVKGVNSAGSSTYYGKDNSGTIGFFPLPAGVDESALKADIKAAKDLADSNKAAIDIHETSINGHGTQLASHAGLIDTNTKNIKVAMKQAASAVDEGLQNRKNAVNAIVADVSNTHKTITLKLMSTAGLVDSALIDLSSWFSNAPVQPGATYKIYHGFTTKTPLSDSEIKSLGTSQEATTIKSLDVTLTRIDTTPSYMWIWIPDAAGSVKGFDFSGFVSTWASTAVSVDGIDGKFYISPNQTSATSIEFEVRV